MWLHFNAIEIDILCNRRKIIIFHSNRWKRMMNVDAKRTLIQSQSMYKSSYQNAPGSKFNRHQNDNNQLNDYNWLFLVLSVVMQFSQTNVIIIRYIFGVKLRFFTWIGSLFMQIPKEINETKLQYQYKKKRKIANWIGEQPHLRFVIIMRK